MKIKNKLASKHSPTSSRGEENRFVADMDKEKNYDEVFNK